MLVKEVGFGMDAADVALLRDAGVAAIDVAGAGGTNWALVEGRRDERAGDVAAAFADWGVATAEALVEAREAAPGLPLIASGGLRDGVDAAKALALGATAAGLARAFLLGAQADTASETAATLVRQLRDRGLGGGRGERLRARPRAPALTQLGEELGDVAGEQLGLLGGREVAAARHHRPAPDVVEALGPLARRRALGDVLVREHRDRGRDADEVVRTDLVCRASARRSSRASSR